MYGIIGKGGDNTGRDYIESRLIWMKQDLLYCTHNIGS